MIFPSLDCEAFEVKGFVLVRARVCVVCVCEYKGWGRRQIALLCQYNWATIPAQVYVN